MPPINLTVNGKPVRVAAGPDTPLRRVRGPGCDGQSEADDGAAKVMAALLEG